MVAVSYAVIEEDGMFKGMPLSKVAARRETLLKIRDQRITGGFKRTWFLEVEFGCAGLTIAAAQELATSIHPGWCMTERQT